MNPKNSEARGFRSHKKANGQFHRSQAGRDEPGYSISPGLLDFAGTMIDDNEPHPLMALYSTSS